MARDQQKTKLHGLLSAQYGTSEQAPGRSTQAEQNGDADGTEPQADAQQQQSEGLYSAPGPFASFAAQSEAPNVDAKHNKESGEGGPGQPGGAATGGAQPQAKTAPDPSGITIKTEQGGASRKVVGVGEKVTFTAKDDGEWTATDSFMGASAGTPGTSFTWQAPASAKNVTISYTANNAKPKTITMTVVAPQSIQFKKLASVPVRSAGAGMKLNLIIQPTNVSFYNVQWKEQPGGAENVSGYFADYQTQSGASLHHDPYAQWIGMGAGNNEVFDYARTEDKPKISVGGKPPAYSQGGYDWNIPNRYRVVDGGKGDGEGQVFTTVQQTARMDPSGRVTITKGEAAASQGADGTTEGEIEKFTSLQEARAKLIPLGGNRMRVSHAIAWFEQARAKGVDAQSIQFMVQAIRSANCQMYLSVQCTNTYKWFDPDPVTVTMGGFSRTTTINTKKQRDWLVSLNEFMDWANAKFSSGSIININADGNSLRTAVAYPFDLQEQAVDGSNGRYLVTTNLRDEVKAD